MVDIPERVLRLAQQGGWIGVDLDGTLFTYTEWVPWDAFGEPIAPMVERVRAWTAAGVPVRIVTARVGLPLTYSKRLSNIKRRTCKVSGELFSDAEMRDAIQRHCVKHGLPIMPVQCHKDLHMIELWDDRAVQVVANTGRTLTEEHAAERAALEGRIFQMLRDVDGGRDMDDCG